MVEVYMQVAHVLRKYNPDEWGGTETYLNQIYAQQGISSIFFSPYCQHSSKPDPLLLQGHEIRRYHACVPVFGLTDKEKNQMISIGGNLLSFDLPWLLWKEKNIDIIHTHALNRIGATAMTIAKLRKIPLVVTIHGYVLDTSGEQIKPIKKGWEWGKVFGALLGSHRLLDNANAIVTVSKREAELLREKYPYKQIVTIPGGVNIQQYQKSYETLPELRGKRYLLIPCRIDPIKNQLWVINQLPKILTKYPDIKLVLAGSSTNAEYLDTIQKQGLENHLLLTGGIPHNDPKLIGLYQNAQAVILPSTIEPFGLVILEAWAAKTPIIASAVSGPKSLISNGHNGLLFDLQNPDSFHAAVDKILTDKNSALKDNGYIEASTKYNTDILSQQMKMLYESLL